MAVVNITKNNFDEILNSEKTVLIDFYADWCGPCKMVAPFIHEIAEENPQYLVGKINVDEEPELASAYDIMTIPTLVVLKDGKTVNQVSGVRPKAQILALLEG